jgi:hypothetical protein
MGGGETFFAEKYFPKGNDSFCLAWLCKAFIVYHEFLDLYCLQKSRLLEEQRIRIPKREVLFQISFSCKISDILSLSGPWVVLGKQSELTLFHIVNVGLWLADYVMKVYQAFKFKIIKE